MKIPESKTPILSEAVVKEKTGKPLKYWFALLDPKGGTDEGRRNLVNHLHSDHKIDEWWAVTLVVEYEKAKGLVEKDGRPKGYSICSTKTITAPIDRVFQAFGDATLLDQWLGPKTKIDFTDGGNFNNGDGDKGTLTRIRKNKDIRISWDNPKVGAHSSVEIHFADKGKGKSGITLNHTRIATRQEADQLREAWGSSLDSLKALLEKS